jgi:hypothetical protein
LKGDNAGDMKRLLLWVIALVIAAAPAVNDLCRFDCERERPPECPLHQQAPHTCAHDHTIGAARLTRASVDVSRSIDLVALALSPCRVAIAPVASDPVRIDREHAPPLRSPRPDVLRI